MVLAMSAWSTTFGLVLIFFVIMPVLAQGLGERAENQAYAADLRGGRDDAAV